MNEASDMTNAERMVFNALRHRPHGATVAKVAHLSGVSERHTRRTLSRLRAQGVAAAEDGIVRHGHQQICRVLWALSYTPECIRLLRRVPRTAVPRMAMPDADAVPPQFWHLFWSGSDGSEVTMSDDELHIATTLIGSADVSAEMWALRNVSTETLRTASKFREYEDGDVESITRPLQLGQAIKATRRGRGLTQTEAASAAGVSRKWLSEVENGKPTAEIGLLLSTLRELGYGIAVVPRPQSTFDMTAHIESFAKRNRRAVRTA